MQEYFKQDKESILQQLKLGHTENDDGASIIWKANPVTSSCPWRLGNVSPFDMHMWTWKTEMVYLIHNGKSNYEIKRNLLWLNWKYLLVPNKLLLLLKKNKNIEK